MSSISKVILLILSILPQRTCFSFDNFSSLQNKEKKSATEISTFYQNSDDIIALEKFDPRNDLTPIKDQGSSSLCWAYSSINAAEASLLKNKLAKKDDLSLNPTSLGYRKYVRNIDPLNNNDAYNNLVSDWANKSGTISQTPSLLSMWQGPISNTLPYNADVYSNSLYRLNSAELISSNLEKEKRILEIKKTIAKYGAVTASCNYVGGKKPYYNDLAVNNGIPHAITLVGWDDTLDKSLFKPGSVNRNGGWLVKNSYLDNPYFYLTYESKISSSTSWCFNFDSLDQYDNNYYYDNNLDDFALSSLKVNEAINIFEAKKGEEDKGEFLKAVNVGINGNNVSVNLKIYSNLPSLDPNDLNKGKLETEQAETFSYSGYQTIKLTNPVQLEKGSKFAILIKVTNTSNDASIKLTQCPNKPSFRKYDSSFSSIMNGALVARIKAYTKSEKIETHQHSFLEATYEWSNDLSLVKAKRICKDDHSHIEEETVNTTSSIIKEGNCLEEGIKRFVSDSFKNPAFKIQTKDISIGLGSHSFGAFIEEIPPTSEKEGTKGHKECLICHKFFDFEGNELTDLSITKLPKTITISVVNGTSSSNEILVGHEVTIKANPPNEGYKFIGWFDNNGTLISNSEEYTFIATKDAYFEARYQIIEPSIPGENTEENSTSNLDTILIALSILSASLITAFIAFLIFRKKKY